VQQTQKVSQARFLHIHEYQSMGLMKKYGITTPNFGVASTPAEAEKAAEKLSGPDYVVKAQVLAGGRGKGVFKSGFKGAVHICNSALEARSIAAKMLGQRLVTKQTGEEGKPCQKVMVLERLYMRRETYFAILLDREHAGPVLVASPMGGMDIEQVAVQTPNLIFKEPIDVFDGIQPAQVERLAQSMGFKGKQALAEAERVIRQLYKLFVEQDATLVEINPLCETHDSRVLCVDAKFNFDDNSSFRHSDLFSLRDSSQEDPREVAAEKAGLNYIQLDGNIGCLVNGAGLAMATMDCIKLHGGSPANFLDIGGGASAQQVTQAFQLLNQDPQVKAILVNIFGGIMRCDVIALGLISAVTELGIKKPLVVRLAGTNVSEARKLIEESGLRMLSADDLEDASTKVVRIVDILKMAEAAHVNVSFEIPL